MPRPSSPKKHQPRLKWKDLVLVESGILEIVSNDDLDVELTLKHPRAEPTGQYHASVVALMDNMQNGGMRVAIRNPTTWESLVLVVSVGLPLVKAIVDFLKSWLKETNGRTISVSLPHVTAKTKGLSPKRFVEMVKELEQIPGIRISTLEKTSARSARKKIATARKRPTKKRPTRE
jgi:hypothetical protein